jgi:ribosomal subunit interface protein
MEITFAVRHCAISEPTRMRTERRLARIARLEPRARSAVVVFEDERDRRRVELRLAVTGRGEVVARGSGGGFHDAVSDAAVRLERQLVRGRGRLRARRAAPRTIGPEATSAL